VGLKYGLPVHSPVDVAGRFTEDVPMYKGIKIWDGNKLIVDDLKKSGHLLGFREIVHSYPHNPRSKTPLIFRATPQWFVRLDDDKYPVRTMALTAAEKGCPTLDFDDRQLARLVLEPPADLGCAHSRFLL
jgi:isoleucyl-tRNA synthetase